LGTHWGLEGNIEWTNWEQRKNEKKSSPHPHPKLKWKKIKAPWVHASAYPLAACRGPLKLEPVHRTVARVSSQNKKILVSYEEREFTPFVFTVAFWLFFLCKKKTLGTQHFKWTTWWHCQPIAIRLFPHRAWMFAWKSALALNLYIRKDVFVTSRTFVAQKQEAATKGSFVVSTTSAGNGSSIPRASMALYLHFYMCRLL
jgi:hypothetical protein